MAIREARELKRPYRICLLGASLDGGNLGVCALGAALVGLIRGARPEARIQFFYGERRGGLRAVPTAEGPVFVRVLNFRLSPRARWGEHLALLFLLALLWRLLPPLRGWLRRHNRRLRALAEADFIGTIHAGDSFSDIYGLRRFLIGVAPDALALLLGKALVFLPQTYGPFSTRLARTAAHGLLRRSARTYARDLDSLATVRKLLGREADKAVFCPDVAFSLEPVKGGFGTIQPPVGGGDRPLVGLNVSGLLAIGGYSRDNMFGLACDYNTLIEELIEGLMHETAVHVLLVPHVIDRSEENDVAACLQVWRAAFARHERRMHLLTGHYNQNHVKYLIGQCDFFIGARMHACIAALSQGVPALGIAYSPKFRGVFESVGVGDLVLDARCLRQEEITAQCLDAFRDRERIRRQLTARAASIREKLQGCFRRELNGAPPLPALGAAQEAGG